MKPIKNRKLELKARDLERKLKAEKNKNVEVAKSLVNARKVLNEFFPNEL